MDCGASPQRQRLGSAACFNQQRKAQPQSAFIKPNMSDDFTFQQINIKKVTRYTAKNHIFY
ncbi:hypothetical protein JF50_15655 [Pseudoalteromonas luteoviolacea]|uniref:Uncharacterized protein n=1 Tax=Pseudoalteromonas luteoviolacea TaxID=43657 RepID=A0A0C1QL78_9GAMM|nr:hypothetical protein JF50_15655 [Pseudoalteromonas luteoviolacea]